MTRPSRPRRRIVVTCEHATNHVPGEYRSLFRTADEALQSHRGWDRGAIELARDLSRAFHVPVIAGRATRLLVDLNRTSRSAHRFSEFTRGVPERERTRILARYYAPHWNAVARAIGARSAQVLHIGAHSFTPYLAGRVRRCDVGLLYDPRRSCELALAREWQRELRARRPDLVVLRNQPYRGWTDGMTTWFRGRYPSDRYCGIELEVNQRWVPVASSTRSSARTKTSVPEWKELRADIVTALVASLDGR